MVSRYSKEEEESETIVRLIEREKDGLYWKLIEEEIADRSRYFQNVIERFSALGIKNEQERVNYNRAVDNLDNLKWFKGLNDRIMNKNMTILEKIRGQAKQMYKKAESFMQFAHSE